MTITALHLIKAAELLNEVASGDAEPDIRNELVRIGAILQDRPTLFEVGTYMGQYAHGLTGHEFAVEHLATLKGEAAGMVV